MWSFCRNNRHSVNGPVINPLGSNGSLCVAFKINISHFWGCSNLMICAVFSLHAMVQRNLLLSWACCILAPAFVSCTSAVLLEGHEDKSRSLSQPPSAVTPAHRPWISASHDVCLHTCTSEICGSDLQTGISYPHGSHNCIGATHLKQFISFVSGCSAIHWDTANRHWQVAHWEEALDSRAVGHICKCMHECTFLRLLCFPIFSSLRRAEHLHVRTTVVNECTLL